MNRLLLLSCATSALVGMGGGASAQQPLTTLEEIVVTATKRSESLQDVPISVSAFTAEMREETGIISTQDQMNFTPGVTYSATADRVAIRGVGRQTNTVGTDPGVAVYQDGFYVPDLLGVGGSTLGVERIEVLRGPQGTLYGRNSIGGAINVIARRPSDAFEGELRAGYNDFGRLTLEGRVSGPLSDRVRASLMASKIDQDEGYFTNINGGPDEGGVTDSYAIEAQLEADVTDRFDIWVRVQLRDWNNRDRNSNLISPYDGRYSLENIPTATWDLPRLGIVNPGVTNPRRFNTNRAASNYMDENITAVTQWTYRFDNFAVKYIGGFQQYDSGYAIDGERGPSPGFNWPLSRRYFPNLFGYLAGAPLAAADNSGLTISVTGDIETWGRDDKDAWSHEINISSTHDGPLQWLLGAYYYQEQYTQHFAISFPTETEFDTVYGLTASPVAIYSAMLGQGAALGLNPAQAQAFAQMTAQSVGYLIATGRPVPTGPLARALYPSGSFLSGIPNPTRDGARTLGALETRSSAVFAQVDYDITEQLHATLGVRYTHDKKEGVEQIRLPAWHPYAIPAGTVLDLNLDGVPDTVTAADQIVSYVADLHPRTGQTGTPKDSWNHTTGTFGLQWKPNDDTMLYASYSYGYKSGGFNLATFSASVDSETIDALEIGLKQTFGGTLQVNAAAFSYNYHGLQTVIQQKLGPGAATSALVNLNEARTRGVEVEAIWSPIQNLRLMANYSYLDAKIEDACCFVDDADPFGTRNGLPGAVPGVQFPQGLAGNRVPFSPKHKAAVNATYTLDFSPGSLSLSATGNYRTSSYYTVFNTPDYLMDGYTTWDFRVAWTGRDDRYAIIGTIANAFDEEAVQSFSTTSPQTSNQQTIGLQPPRIVSLELQYRF